MVYTVHVSPEVGRCVPKSHSLSWDEKPVSKRGKHLTLVFSWR